MHLISNLLGLLTANIGLSTIIMQMTSEFKEGSFVQYLIINGGIGGILFIIWWFTYKMSVKQAKDAITQTQAQHEQTLQIMQKQFDASLVQNQKASERMFAIQIEDAKYKAMIAENITKLSTQIELQDRRRPQ